LHRKIKVDQSRVKAVYSDILGTKNGQLLPPLSRQESGRTGCGPAGRFDGRPKPQIRRIFSNLYARFSTFSYYRILLSR